MSDEDGNKLRIARINMLQVIVVSLITTIGGFSAAWIAKPTEVIEDQTQTWLRIDEVRLSRVNSDSSYVRIIAEVDGISYSMPSNIVWAAVGPGMAKEKFLLPTEKKYNIKFKGFLTKTKNSNDVLRIENREIITVRPTESGDLKGRYDLYPVIKDANVLVPYVTVSYSIIKD